MQNNTIFTQPPFTSSAILPQLTSQICQVLESDELTTLSTHNKLIASEKLAVACYCDYYFNFIIENLVSDLLDSGRVCYPKNSCYIVNLDDIETFEVFPIMRTFDSFWTGRELLNKLNYRAFDNIERGEADSSLLEFIGNNFFEVFRKQEFSLYSNSTVPIALIKRLKPANLFLFWLSLTKNTKRLLLNPHVNSKNDRNFITKIIEEINSNYHMRNDFMPFIARKYTLKNMYTRAEKYDVNTDVVPTPFQAVLREQSNFHSTYKDALTAGYSTTFFNEFCNTLSNAELMINLLNYTKYHSDAPSVLNLWLNTYVINRQTNALEQAAQIFSNFYEKSIALIKENRILTALWYDEYSTVLKRKYTLIRPSFELAHDHCIQISEHHFGPKRGSKLSSRFVCKNFSDTTLHSAIDVATSTLQNFSLHNLLNDLSFDDMCALANVVFDPEFLYEWEDFSPEDAFENHLKNFHLQKLAELQRCVDEIIVNNDKA